MKNMLVALFIIQVIGVVITMHALVSLSGQKPAVVFTEPAEPQDIVPIYRCQQKFADLQHSRPTCPVVDLPMEVIK